MTATGIRLEEFKFDLPLDIILAKVCGADLNLVPLESSAFRSLDLTFVNWRELSNADVPVDDEEAQGGLA